MRIIDQNTDELFDGLVSLHCSYQHGEKARTVRIDDGQTSLELEQGTWDFTLEYPGGTRKKKVDAIGYNPRAYFRIDPDEAKGRKTRADEAKDRQKKGVAESKIEQAERHIEYDSGAAASALGHARLANRNGNYDQAREIAETALELAEQESETLEHIERAENVIEGEVLLYKDEAPGPLQEAYSKLADAEFGEARELAREARQQYQRAETDIQKAADKLEYESGTAAEALDRARDALEDGGYERAEREAETALELAQKETAVLGVIRQTEETIREKFPDGDQSEAGATLQKAYSRLQNGDFEEAWELARKAVSKQALAEARQLEQTVEHADVASVQLVEAANQAFSSGEYEKATEIAEQATSVLETEADLVRAKNTLTVLQRAIQNSEDAPLVPEDVEYWCQRGFRALEAENYDVAADHAQKASKAAREHLEDLAEHEVELVAPLAELDLQRESQLTDLARQAVEALDRGDHETAISQAQDAKAGFDTLLDDADEHDRTATDAFENEDHPSAIDEWERAVALYAQLQPIAESIGRTDAAADVATSLETAEENAEMARQRLHDRISEHTSQAERALQEAKSHANDDELVAAVEAYANAQDKFAAAVDLAEDFDDADAEPYREQVEETERELDSLAERAIEQAHEALQRDDVETSDRVSELLHSAADAFSENEYDRAVETARQAVTQAYDELQTAAADCESSADAHLDADEYADAIADLEEARRLSEHSQEIATVMANGDTVATVESHLERLDERIETVETAGAEYVEALTTAGADALDTGDRTFGDGEYEAARDAYTDARDAYAEAVDRGTALGLDVRQYRRHSDLADERIEYTLLAEGSDRTRAAMEQISSDPTAAVEQFDDVIAYLDELDLSRDEIDLERKELLREAERGQVTARIEQGRKLMEAAEESYDEGDLYEAKERYRDASAHLESIETDVEADSDVNVDEVELFGVLLDACRENVRHINQELTGISDIREGESDLQRVGSPGEPLPDADESPPDAGEAFPDVGESLPAGDDTPPHHPRRGRFEFDPHVFGPSKPHEKAGHHPPDHERIELLGEGGNATVWRVRLSDVDLLDGESDRRIDAALKIPKWEGTLTETDIERFLGEAAVWSRIDAHRNIVSVYDWGFGAEPWLLVEYVEGGDLRSHVGELSLEEALQILVEITEALRYARGIDHLDIKPENVLLDADGTAKLADWGLAKVAFQHAHTDTTLGLSPPYAAPEQVDRTLGDRDYRTDIYQLGVTGYELVTGELPFDPAAPESLEDRILREEPRPPSAVNPDLPEAIDEVLLTALAKNPEERYEAVIRFRDALVDVQRLLSEHTGDTE